MKIVKGKLYRSESGLEVRATSNSREFVEEVNGFIYEVGSFAGEVVKGNHVWSVGESLTYWASSKFTLIEEEISHVVELTDLQKEKQMVKQDLINSINTIFDNDENTCENLNEVRDYISNLMITDF